MVQNHAPAPDAVTLDDLLTWEVQFEREGTLPPAAIRRLLAAVKQELDY